LSENTTRLACGGSAPKWTIPVLVAGCAASIAAQPGMPGAFGAALFTLTLAITIIDWRSLIIPDWLNASVFALGVVRTLAFADSGAAASVAVETIARGAVLAGVLLLVRNVYRRARGREGIGLGDVKLGGAGGVWVGWTMLPVVIEIAALSALAVFLVSARLTKKPVRWDERLPFGSFLAPAIWATWLIETMLAR